MFHLSHTLKLAASLNVRFMKFLDFLKIVNRLQDKLVKRKPILTHKTSKNNGSTLLELLEEAKTGRHLV